MSPDLSSCTALTQITPLRGLQRNDLDTEMHVKTCAQLGCLAASEVITHFGPRPLVSLNGLAKDKGLI